MARSLPFADHIARYSVPADLTLSANAGTDRHNLYRTFEGYYYNTLFAQVGLAALDKATAENAATDTVAGIYNPAAAIVDAYVNWTLCGKLGPESADTSEVTIQTANPLLEAPILKIWQWSGMERAKLLIPFYAALFGDALLLCVARPTNGIQQGKTWIEVRHPDVIRHAEFDNRGNLIYLELEEQLLEPMSMDRAIDSRSGRIAAAPESYTQTIIMTKDEFATLKNGKPFDFGNGAWRWTNPWGFIPAKKVKQKDGGDNWGLNAFHSSLSTINDLCLNATIASQLIGQWLAPQWAIFGVGRNKNGVSRDGSAWLFENPGDAKALTANVDFNGAYIHINAGLKWLAERHPELNLTKIRDSNVATGVAIRAMLFDLIKVLQMAQDNYDDALISALQMCLSMGQQIDGNRALEGFDGIGSYEKGELNFTFNRPELLPISKLEQAQADAEMSDLARQQQLNDTLSTGSPTTDVNDAAAFIANRVLNGTGQ